MASDKEFPKILAKSCVKRKRDGEMTIAAVSSDIWDHQQSKLDAKDELLREAVEIMDRKNLDFLSDNKDCENFLNKPEIKALRGE